MRTPRISVIGPQGTQQAKLELREGASLVQKLTPFLFAATSLPQELLESLHFATLFELLAVPSAAPVLAEDFSEKSQIKQVDILPGKDVIHRFKSTYNGPVADYHSKDPPEVGSEVKPPVGSQSAPPLPRQTESNPTQPEPDQLGPVPAEPSGSW